MDSTYYLKDNEHGEFVNYNLVVMVIFLREHDYDLFFKMMGGQNSHSYSIMKGVKHLNSVIKDRNMSDYLVSVNKEGGITSDNHYKVAIAINHNLDIRTTEDPNTDFSPKYGEEWLKETFTEKEVKKIKNYLRELRKTIN